MSLLAAMFVLAGLYLLMQAYLVALFQIIIYIGAILVLFIFVCMLLNVKNLTVNPMPTRTNLVIGIIALLLTAAMSWLSWQIFLGSVFIRQDMSLQAEKGIKEIAIDLFTRHLLIFELTSVLLFVAAVGAIFLSRKKREEVS